MLGNELDFYFSACVEESTAFKIKMQGPFFDAFSDINGLIYESG